MNYEEGMTKSATFMRRALALLQEYYVIFKYRPGRENLVADCMSRFCDDETSALL